MCKYEMLGCMLGDAAGLGSFGFEDFIMEIMLVA